MVNAAINLTATPQEFFKEKVEQASTSLHYQCDTDVEFYVVNLLCEFINPTNIEKIVNVEGNFLEKPLAFILKDAMEAPEHQKADVYRRLGDISLYVSGFFQEYFTRKTFDISYYIDLGSAAYSEAAGLKKQRDGQILDSMAKDFLKLVDVLSEVSESINPKQKDILSVYDKWNSCQSSRMRRILEAEGIIPIQIKTKIPQ